MWRSREETTARPYNAAMRSLLLRTPRTLLPLIVSALLLASINPARAQPRVETDVALSHVIKKVDAVVPGEARAKKIGGPVIADVTIGAGGKVLALTILSGPNLLRPEAERAFRQWVFRPFTVDGKPDSVRAILEIDFPDPIREEEHRHYEDYRAADYECRRQLELDASTAEAACAAATRGAELLPPDRVLERSGAVAHHGRALMAGGRTAEAIADYERAYAMNHVVSRGPDADSADLRQTLAVLHQRLGENDKADAEYAAAIEEYAAAIREYTAAFEKHSAAIAGLPQLRESYERRLRSALIRYAELKRSTGDPSAAAALEARAAAIAPPSASLLPLAITRSVDGIDVNEPVDARLSDEDLGGVRSALVRTGKKLWRLQASASREGGSGANAIGSVYAFFAPDIVTPAFRRGIAALVMSAPVSAAKNAPSAWSVVKNRFVYVQVATGGADAAYESPIPVMETVGSSMPGDEDLSSVVRMVREKAVPKATDKYLSDVQPWPIRDIRASNDEMTVILRDPAHEDHFQKIRLRKTSGQWAVVELMEVGRRPPK
jgi:tetratricopeptide (TPR) repeat protein